MQVSPLYFALVEHFEGLKLKAYKDSKGIPTIGIGTIKYPDGTPVKMGDQCTKEEARDWCARDTADAAAQVLQEAPSLTQAQFDACVSLVYNIGGGAWRKSTLLKCIKGGTGNIADAFLMWNKVKIEGVLTPVEGLTRRRKSEAYLYLNGENHRRFFQA